MKLNENCYRFEEVKYDTGLLDNSVDATYILHLEGNGRLEHIQEQLKVYHPTCKVYIVFNKGFRKCNKKLHLESPPVDLVDAYLEVFKHSTKHSYGNILILEDDFIFNKEILKPTVQKEVNQFLERRRHTSFVYYLGCIPYLQMPYDRYHNMILFSTGTHACIYSQSLIVDIIQTQQSSIEDWDYYHNLHSYRYAFYMPLCYQLFPETENSKTWSDYFMGLGKIAHLIFKQMDLDKQPEPGFSRFYMFSNVMFCVILIFLIILIYILVLVLQKYIDFGRISARLTGKYRRLIKSLH